jgi:kynurenine formamidase
VKRTPFVRRSLHVEDVDAAATRHRNWGQWGPDDQLGSANYITAESIIAASNEVRRGAVFALGMPMDNNGPMLGTNGRVNPQHIMLRDGGDILAEPSLAVDIRVTDDAVYMPLQSSTQWDALCHIMFRNRAYNDRPPSSVTSGGAKYNSITNFKDRAIGRGVLLDIPRANGVPWLEPGTVVQDADLEHCARAQGVEIREGDFVLVRTGHITQCRERSSWGTYAGGESPGLGLSAADYLCPRHVVAVATDTWGIEAIPYETDDVRAPLHVVLLVNAGIYIGEMWDLDELANDCAADQRWTFLLVAPPLTITGAVGSPLNPLAIK